ncbi:MAG: T9SS type A sorting domain-containing protein [Bacteroidota bacterium]|nr:T9SS type A sorting domain-containing protein [Bacteroidota bacterium]MDP4214879.1 T9SS type A sorting domain-containing protein [Bacteroidota bacterium]MDP4244741.1 T9SS type A sorting domain-containing protein [Bacteroidota bacterium]MDP4252399.1 T9SS type A sorting domain-containing protein [Bacteroidota bacterium]MDP4257956.1 T9SS type A sorting domain-containing protein [Bacteroidota bacterium]
MKRYHPIGRRNSFFFLFSLFIPFSLFSQTRTQTARSNTVIDAFCHGFYESLPPDYNSTSKKYPLMVFLHGQGEIGDGSPAQLPSVLVNGPPMKINNGTFPDPVTVNGQSYNFIVISPQLNTWPVWGDEQTAVNDIINYAIAHYRVDTSRMYLTGLSMGGGIAWEYASYNDGTVDYVKRLAGLLVVAGASYPESERAAAMAQDHLPVWATNNQDDPTVPAYYSIDYVQEMNDDGANPAAAVTIFPVSGHGGWVQTYNTLTNASGLTVYQWMLQFQRVGNNVVIGGSILPVELTSYTAALSPDRSQVDVNWSTAKEENNRYFTLERSSDGRQFNTVDTVGATNQAGAQSYSYVDRSPLAGKNYYRLSQTDMDGKTTYFSILEVTVPGQTTALRVSPNPARNSITLSMAGSGMGSSQGSVQVTLSDAQGKTVRVWKLAGQNGALNQVLDITGLPSGSYFVSVTGSSARATAQFVKE